jgi:hypothetical protein
MCPFCLGSVGLIVAGATSAGGLAALAVKLSRKKSDNLESTGLIARRVTGSKPIAVEYSLTR